MRCVRAALVLGCLALAWPVGAADWLGWRGPTGQGLTEDKDLPLTWGGKDQDNVLWKVMLPGQKEKARQDQNQSSPIVVKGQVVITVSYWPTGTDTKEYPEHHVVSYRASDGGLLWDVTVKPGPWKLTDLRGGYTAPTPASDGERIYVLFGSSVLAALDLEGKLVWREEIRPFNFDVAIGSSPVLHKDNVLLQCDQVSKNSRLLAFERKSGKLAWEQKRPEVGFSHSTPLLARIKDRAQLLVGASDALQGLDPDNGQVLWWAAARGDTVSPVLGAGVVYLDSGRGGPGVAVEPTGSGNVTKTDTKWKIGSVPGGFSSPVVVGEHLYRLHDPGVIHCWKLTTGAEVFVERLQGVSTAASPIVTTEGRIYLASAGRSYVLKAGPTLEILGQSDLGDSGTASPAVADGKLFLKGRQFLFCVGKKIGAQR